jgi:hypothetical protein
VAELQYLRTYLSDLSNPWEVLIGHVMVPRMPNIRSAGDASQLGGGGINHTLRFWFDCRWNARIQPGVKLNPRHPNYVHINCLEYIVLLFADCCMYCLPGKPVRFGARGIATLLSSYTSHSVGPNRQYFFQILDPSCYYRFASWPSANSSVCSASSSFCSWHAV